MRSDGARGKPFTSVVRRWWTLPEIRELARLAKEEELSASRIAKALGRTRGSVASAAKRYGIRFAGESGAPFGNQNRRGRKER